MDIVLRAARRDDAPVLATLVNMAGEGMPLAIWSDMAAPGQDPWDVGRTRAARDEGSFSWRNAVVADHDGAVVGMIVTYVTASVPEVITDDIPAMFGPMIELENQVPETLYVNILATLPEFRGQGIATRLMQHVEKEAPAAGQSLIVADMNHTARRFYEGLGFVEKARAELVKGLGWECESHEWVLIVKDRD